MSKTNKDNFYNAQRREERKRNLREDHTEYRREKRTKNALRSNNLDDLLSFEHYFK